MTASRSRPNSPSSVTVAPCSFASRSDSDSFRKYGPPAGFNTATGAASEIGITSYTNTGTGSLGLSAAVTGGVLLALLIRRSSTPRRRFIQITTGLTAISCALPAAFADTTASKVALVGLHLVAAAIIVPVLARHAD